MLPDTLQDLVLYVIHELILEYFFLDFIFDEVNL